MIETVNISYIKEKFATLLSKLYTNEKIHYSDISERLIITDFFDMFESNDISYFINSSYEKMMYDLFNKEPVFDEELNTVIYWAGLQYMNIFLNKRIPLKQIFLCCSLEDMIGLFDVFHEVNEAELIDHFISFYYQSSILRNLRSRRGYTLNQLSIITGISFNTLKYFEYDNLNLYNTTFESINVLSRALDFDQSFFKRKSDFVAYSDIFLTDKQLFSELTKSLDEYYKNVESYFVEYGVMYAQTSRRKIPVDEALLKSAINRLIDNYNGKELLF